MKITIQYTPDEQDGYVDTCIIGLLSAISPTNPQRPTFIGPWGALVVNGLDTHREPSGAMTVSVDVVGHAVTSSPAA